MWESDACRTPEGKWVKSPPFMGIVALAGGGMLVWMGVNMVRSSGGLSLNRQNAENQSRRIAHPVLIGMLASLSNPYWTLWWATIGLGYLAAAMKFGLKGVVVFFLGHILADYTWYALISVGITRGKRLFKDRSYRIMIQICGFFLIGLGAWFVFSVRQYLISGFGGRIG